MNQKRKPAILVPSDPNKLYHFGRVGGGPVHPKVREANRRRAKSWAAGFRRRDFA